MVPSIHLVPALSTTLRGGVFRLVNVIDADDVCHAHVLQCTPWGTVPTSTRWLSRTAPGIMLQMGGYAMLSVLFSTKGRWGCVSSVPRPPWFVLRCAVGATTIVLFQDPGSLLVLSTLAQTTVASLAWRALLA